MTLTITTPQRTPVGADQIELAATVNGECLWFRVPHDRAPVLRGEPFVACLLVPAMATGQDLVLDDALPLCPHFVANIHRLMDVLRLWGPALGHRLRPIALRAVTEPAPATRDTIAFFSGGIDGLYTYLESRTEITHAAFGHGIDFQLDNPMAHEAVRLNRDWLAQHHTPLIEFASNARFVGHHFGVGWNSHNGLCLGGFAHALGAAHGLIAAGHAWNDYTPSGSHLMSDPLVSHATTTITHSGFGPLRWEKLARVAREPGVLDLLRVCWQDRGYNCGRCEKCRRTMLLLHLLGLSAPTFPSTRTLADVLPRRITDADGAAYARQAHTLAQRLGRPDVVRLIDRLLWRWEARRWLVQADATLLGGALKRLRR